MVSSTHRQLALVDSWSLATQNCVPSSAKCVTLPEALNSLGQIHNSEQSCLIDGVVGKAEPRHSTVRIILSLLNARVVLRCFAVAALSYLNSPEGISLGSPAVPLQQRHQSTAL